MAWIKRNLIFVIIVAVGLGLTGYCGYLLYNAVNDNAGINDEYQQKLSSWKEMQQKAPSKDSIKVAMDDQEREHKFLIDFRKSFAPFPAPPARDEQGFKTFVLEKLVRFRAGATNADVELPPDYPFAFSGLIGKLSYPAANIGPWMQQFEEIGAILDILYAAKINALISLQRAPVAPEDAGVPDCLATPPVTNAWGVVDPYKITFRGFSTELAAVLEGFARSSNCFIVKSVDVVNDKTFTPVVTDQMTPPPIMARSMPAYAAPPRMSARDGRMGRIGPGMMAPPPMAAPRPQPQMAIPAGPVGPVTILSETPLMITISVDAVKLNVSEH